MAYQTELQLKRCAEHEFLWRDQAFPTAAEGEYYWVDLIGLTVLNRESVALGRVKDLMSTGAQTVLVLEFEQDGKSCERMIPFVASFVDDVNLIDRVITVDWQPDY